VVLDEMTARMRSDHMMTPLAELLAALAALLLAIGCANACGALLMRGESRAREIALKIALGAGPIRLLRESLLESGQIACAGSALALPLAWIVTEALKKSIVLPTDFAISIEARIDGRVMLLALMAAAFATLFCGVMPTLLVAWRMDVWGVLKMRERSSKGRARNLLAMVEIALAAALAATGGSLWAGLNTARNADLGYRTEGISVMTFDPGQTGYDETRTRAFYRDLTERVKSLPGVQGAALAQSLPLGMTGAQKQVRFITANFLGNSLQTDGDETTVWMNIVTPEYFELMHIALVAGRVFDDRDQAVVIVNEELAKRVRVGEKMRVSGRMADVIGVVRTGKYMRWDEAPRPFFYMPYAQNYAPRMTLHVKSAAPVIEDVRRIAGTIPMSDARTLREYFDNGAMFGMKAALRIAGVAGGGGLLLALAGLYGVVSSAAGRRSREIGIRIALGARHSAVFAMILCDGMMIAVVGIGIGLTAGLAGTRLLRGLGEWSWWAGAGSAGVMIGASLIACAVPAIRALSIEVAQALRDD
jgi:predicted permease